MWNISILTGLLARRLSHHLHRKNVHRNQQPISGLSSWMWTMAVHHFSSMPIAYEIAYPNGDKRLKQYLDGLKQQQSQKHRIEEPLLANILQNYEQRLSIVDQYHELTAEMANETGADIVALANEEKQRFHEILTKLDDEIIDQVLLLNDDESDDISSVMLEIQAGVGGQEAMLFARELGEMYENFLNFRHWNYNLLEEDSTGIGGIRNLSIAIENPHAYAVLKNEAGIHRVQRVPKTEKGGRLHTSTAVVVIVPCADDIQIKLNSDDLKIEAKRASGPGGQSVNKSESAIRIVHLPTGIAVECQEERTFHRNKQIALKKLHGRLYQIEFNKQTTSQRTMRKSQTGARTRNEKIRTYNYAQNRITDHRLSGGGGGGSGTVHDLDEFLAGNECFNEFITKVNKFIERQRLNDILDCKVGGGC